jgi:hypothetical protein
MGKILEYYYFNQESGLQYRTTYSIEKTKADILIFGSSRANHHYNPIVFENRLKMSYYNVGRDGNFIFYHFAVLKGVLKRYSPKIVILDFVDHEFEENQMSYDRLSSLLPYYKKHPEMRSIIELRSKYEKLKMISSIYPYNSTLLTIAAGNAEFNKKRKSDIKGYVPLTKILNDSLKTVSTNEKYKIDSIKVKAFESFIQLCKDSNIKLYVVQSPYYRKLEKKDYSVEIGQEIAKNYNVAFLDYESDSSFINNSHFFADVAHLNDSGAVVFSNKLIDDISKISICEK